jgi:hypothetical protein
MTTENTCQKVLKEIEDAVYLYQKTGFFKYVKDYVDAVEFLAECQDDCSHPIQTYDCKITYCQTCLAELDQDQGEFNPKTGGYDYETVIKDRRIPRLDVLKKEPIV